MDKKNNNLSDSGENKNPSPQESNPQQNINSQDNGNSSNGSGPKKPYNRYRRNRYRKPKTTNTEDSGLDLLNPEDVISDELNLTETTVEKSIQSKPVERLTEGKPDLQKPEQRSSEQKPEQRPNQQRPNQRVSEQKTNEQRTNEQRSNEQKTTSEEKPTEQRREQKPEQKSNERRPQVRTRTNERKPQGERAHHNPRTQAKRNEGQERFVPSNQLISVVIPLFNEEESLSELSMALQRTFESMGANYEVIFVDDGSTDGSFKKIRDIHARNNKFHVIKFRRNYGKSAALAAGFRKVKGDIVITMDADLQDDPAEIPELVRVLNSGYDLVSGWKKVRYDPFIKKHTSKIFNYFTSKISGVRLHDFNCGLKAYKKDVVKNIKVYGEMHRYIPALAHLSGFKVTEKPVKHHARKYGVTKFGANRFLNGFLDLMTVAFTTKFITKPLHLFGALGMLSFFFGFLTLAYLTFMKYFKDQPISERPLFFIGILFVIVGVQFITLGLIAEMITKSRSRDEDSLIESTF